MSTIKMMTMQTLWACLTN